MDMVNRRPTQGDPTMESGDWKAQLQRQRISNKIMDILKRYLPFSQYKRLQELKKIAQRIEQEIFGAATTQSEYSRMICFMMLTMETRLQNPIPDPMQPNTLALYNSNPSVPFDLTATTSPNSGGWQEEVYQKIKAMKEVYLLDLRRTQVEIDAVGKLTMESVDWQAQNPMQSYSAAIGVNPSDSGAQVMQQQVNNQGLPISVPFNNIQRAQQRMSQSMHNNIGSTGMQDSSGISSALPPGSGLQQPTMTNGAGQNSNLQIIQNMSTVQQNIVGNTHYLYQQQLLQIAKQKLQQPSMQPHIQQQQQQTQNSQYLYPQQLHQIAEQKLQQSSMQPHIQLQPNMLQRGHMQQSQMMSQSMYCNIGSSGMQGSSSSSSTLPPGLGLQLPTMANVAGQNLNMQNSQNMSSIQQNQLIGQQYNYSDTQKQKQQQQLLQQQRLRPTEGTSGVVGRPTMESGDWRAQLQADSRERIKNKIMDTMKRHLPFSGQQELDKRAERLEEEIHTVATSQSDYLRKISLKMLTMETRPQSAMSDPM